MSELPSTKVVEILNIASEELGIPPQHLKLANEKVVTLVHYPMLSLGDPVKDFNRKELMAIEHMIIDLKGDIHHIVNQATPFKEKASRSFNLQYNMTSAFLNMVALKMLFPQLDILMPDGIENINPGMFYPNDAELNNGYIFKGKKYLPPSRECLSDQFGIAFQIRPPKGKNVYTHNIPFLLRK